MKLFGFLLLGLSLLSIVLILGRHTKYKQEMEETFRLQAESAQKNIDHSREILANQNILILDKNRIIAEMLGVLPKSIQRTINRFQSKYDLSTTTDLSRIVSVIS